MFSVSSKCEPRYNAFKEKVIVMVTDCVMKRTLYLNVVGPKLITGKLISRLFSPLIIRGLL